MAAFKPHSKVDAAISFARKAEQLSLVHPHSKDNDSSSSSSTAAQATAVEAKFITDSDPVIELASGDRLPAVPLTEAQRLNELKDSLEENDSSTPHTAAGGISQERQQEKAAAQRETFAQEEPESLLSSLSSSLRDKANGDITKEAGTGVSLQKAVPPSRTNPLFPPLPLYGPPSIWRNLQCRIFRVTSFFLSLGFLAVIVLGSAFTSVPMMFRHIGMRMRFKDPDSRRPFYEEEKRKRKARREAEREWVRNRKRRRSMTARDGDREEFAGRTEEFIPTEGGKDPLVCDVAYYARRVGLDIEEFKVQTEDGFIIDLWHVYNPNKYTPASKEERDFCRPDVFYKEIDPESSASRSRWKGQKKYPVLMMHGLLQSAGAYCSNDDDSLAFFLAKRYVSSSSLCPFLRLT